MGSPGSSPTTDPSYHHQHQHQQQGQTSSLENPTESARSITSIVSVAVESTKNETTESTMRASTTTPSTPDMDRFPRRRQSNSNNGSINTGSSNSAKEYRIREQLHALQTLCSRLDLMVMGTLLLAPSTVVYYTSARMAIHGRSAVVGEGSDYSAVLERVQPWIMAVGAYTPLVAYMVLARLECARAARKGDTVATCTGGPYARLKSRLTARFQQTQSLPSNTNDIPSGIAMEQSRSRPHVGLAPKKLLLRSLGLWTVLTIMATRFGMNHPVSFMSGPVHSSPPSMSAEGSGEGPYCGIPASAPVPTPAPSFIPGSLPSENRDEDYPMFAMDWTGAQEEQLEDVQYYSDIDLGNEEEYYEDETNWANMTPEILEAMVQAAENDDIMDSEWLLPQLSETYENADTDGGEYIEMVTDNGEEEELASALRHFWDVIEDALADEVVNLEADEVANLEVDEAANLEVDEAANLEADSDDQFSSPSSFEPTAPLPCSEKDPLDNDWRSKSNNDWHGRSNNYNNGYTFGRVFEYVPIWTEAMLLAVSTCGGTVALGFRLARQQAYELASKLQNELQAIDPNEEIKTIGRPWVRMLSLLAAFILMSNWVLIFQPWDLSMLFFACLGFVFMIVVHVWVPEDIQDLNIYSATDSDVVPGEDDDSQSREPWDEKHLA